MNIGGASVTYYMCQISACQVLQVMHRWIEWISTVYTKSQNFWVINTVWNSGPLPKWRKHHDNRNNEDKSFDSPIQNQNCQCCAQQRLHYPSLLHALVPCQSVVWPHEYSSMLLCTCSCRFIWNLSVFGFSSRRMDGWGLLRMSVGGSNRVILIKIYMPKVKYIQKVRISELSMLCETVGPPVNEENTSIRGITKTNLLVL